MNEYVCPVSPDPSGPHRCSHVEAANIPAFWPFWRQQGQHPPPNQASPEPKCSNHASSTTLVEPSNLVLAAEEGGFFVAGWRYVAPFGAARTFSITAMFGHDGRLDRRWHYVTKRSTRCCVERETLNIAASPAQ